MKKSEEDRHKCVVYESTRAPLTRALFPNGEGKEEAASPPFLEDGILALSERIHAYVEKKNNDGQSLPRVGKVASGASRIGF